MADFIRLKFGPEALADGPTPFMFLGSGEGDFSSSAEVRQVEADGVLTLAAVKRKESPGATLRCNGRLTPSTCSDIVRRFIGFRRPVDGSVPICVVAEADQNLMLGSFRVDR